MPYTRGQRIIYTKRGERACFDTEFHGVYLKPHARNRHTIRIDGVRGTKVVGTHNLRPEQ